MASVGVCGEGCVFDVQIQMQVPQLSDKAFYQKYWKGLTLVQALGGQEIGLFWLVDSYWGYLISHWLAILLTMVGFSTKPNAETVATELWFGVDY